MGGRRSHRVLAPPDAAPAEPPLDVLAGGAEPPGPAARRLAAGTAALVLLLGGTALLVGRGAPGGGPVPAADPVRFALHPRSAVVPRHVPAGTGRPAVAALHVELVNTGERAVRLTGAELVPGGWRVEVADRLELRPGWSAVLALSREVDCGPDADHGPVPAELVVRADAGGRAVVRRLDVGPDQQAYDGRLDDVLAAPGRACEHEAAGPLPGPIGDLRQVRGGSPTG